MSERFLRSKRLRNLLFVAADGKCQQCGQPLSDNWHADHVVPWSVTRKTNVHDMQALCPECNQKKGVAMLRNHQQDLLNRAKKMASQGRFDGDYLLCNVFPGGGKSVLPVIAASEFIKARMVDRVCVVVPRLSLKRQGALAFYHEVFRKLLGHQLEIMEAGNEPDPSRGTAGYITTYQAIAADSAGINALEFRRHRYLLVLDEIHHVAAGEMLHRSLTPLWDSAAFRLALTGTVDRNEGDRIAFLEYEEPEEGRLYPRQHIRYRLSQAIAERANIPITFEHVDAEVRYIDRDGQQVWLGTLNASEADARDGIWAALNSSYAEQLLARCVNHWRQWKLSKQRSQLLAVCASIRQAKRAASVLKSLGVDSDIAVSDDDRAQEVIKRFREQRLPDALVTVQMCYEGLDVPPLTHLACLTHIRSFPWLMQMFARVMRFDPDGGPWEGQHAFAFVPDDPLMQRAIDYIRREQALGIEEIKNAGNKGSKSDKDPASAIVPLSSGATRERASGLSDEDDLSYAETAQVKSLMAEFQVYGSPLNVARLLRRHSGSGGQATSPVPPGSASVSTPKDREEALRSSIQTALNRIDHAGNYEPGTMNKRAMTEFGGKSRTEMKEEELLRVWRWACEQLDGFGVKDSER